MNKMVEEEKIKLKAKKQLKKVQREVKKKENEKNPYFFILRSIFF